MVEIDLLRQGKAMPMNGQEISSHYRLVVSRSHERTQADLYPFNLPESIPLFPLPLQPEDPEITINLQELLNSVYDQGSYDLAIDYHQEPPPPIIDGAWLDRVLCP